MNSCLFLLGLVLVLVLAATAELEQCYNETKLQASFDSSGKAFWQKVTAICRKENPNLNKNDTHECNSDKVIAAIAACKKNTKILSMEYFLCMDKQLGITTEFLYDFKKYKTHVLYSILDDKKKIVEEAITPCENEIYFMDCAFTNLAKFCREPKEWQEIIEELGKEQTNKKNK